VGVRAWTLGILTNYICNTKFSVMNNTLRPYSDTEVPSYSLAAFGKMLWDGATSAASNLGNLVSTGAGKIGNLVSEIPIVGNVVGDVVSHAGAGIGNLVSGNIGGGLGSLYTAADTALGGLLPGVSGAYNVPLTAAVGEPTGYLSSLYTGADKALGGYLPNFGTFSQYTSPAQAAAQAAAASQMGTGGVPVNGVGNGAGGVAVDQAGNVIPAGTGGFWDTTGKIVNTAAGVGSLYSMLTAPKAGAGNTGQAQAQYRQITGGTPGTAIKPGVQGANTGSNVGTAVGTGVGGANSRGQGSNETGDLAQVQAGVSEDGAIVGSSKEMDEMVNAFIDQLYESIDEEGSPSEENTRIVNRRKKKRGGATTGKSGGSKEERSSLRPNRRTG
jgi:hypothetical protein